MWFTVIQLLAVIKLINGQVFDTNFPIVFELPPPLTNGHFGYAINRLDNDDLLVGAPTVTSAVNYYRKSRSGALFKCPIDLRNRRSYCVEINLPLTGIRTNEINMIHNNYTDGMFIGGTISSNGQSAAVCGHSWYNDFITNDEYRHPLGRCWLINNQDSTVINLIAFSNVTKQTKNYSYYYSHANGGFSSIFIDDDVIIGAPGFNQWRGGLATWR